MLLILLLGGTRALADAPATQPDASASTQPDVDPLADQIFHQCSDYLAQTPAFSVHAEIWKDEVLPSGHKIQVTRQIDFDLRRPDHLHVDARAHRRGRAIWYDGKSLTVLDRANNLYSTVDAPSTIDQTLDFASDTYGITIPLEDLAVSDPYASAMQHVTEGGYFGDEPILGVPSRHIGFSTDKIDFQLWVADGTQPLLQKLVITYKTEDQSPQYTAIFSKWTLTDRAADLAFQFIPPPGSSAIPMESQTPQGKKP
jgi:hypothetical protein